MSSTPSKSDMRFDYSVSPQKIEVSTADDLTPSRVDLEIVVSNPAAGDVECKGLQFSFNVGDGVDALTTEANLGSIGTPTCTSADWSVSLHSAGVYRALPDSPTKGMAGRETITVTIPGIVVNEVRGGTVIRIVESHDTDPAEKTVGVVKIASKLSLTDLRATPVVSSNPGDKVTLSWDVKGHAKTSAHPTGVTLIEVPVSGMPAAVAANCHTCLGVVADHPALSGNPIDVTSPHVVHPDQDSLYIVTAHGRDSYKQAQVIAKVPSVAPKIEKFAAEFQHGADGSQQLVFTWATNEAVNACQMSGDAAMLAKDVERGGYTIPPKQQPPFADEYTLTAFSRSGQRDSKTIRARGWAASSSTIPTRVSQLVQNDLFSPDGGLLYLPQGDAHNEAESKVAILDTKEDRVVGELTYPNPNSKYITFYRLSRDGRRFIVGMDWRFLVLDTTTGKVVYEKYPKPYDVRIHDMQVSPDGEILYLIKGDLDIRGISAWDVSGSAKQGEIIWRRPCRETKVAILRDGKTLLITDGGKEVTLLDGKELFYPLTLPAAVSGFVMSPTQDVAYGWSMENLQILDLRSGKVTAQRPSNYFPDEPSVSPDGSLLFFNERKEIPGCTLVMDAKDLRVIQSIKFSKNRRYGIAVTPSNKFYMGEANMSGLHVYSRGYE